jgi:protein-disulfide isomerase
MPEIERRFVATGAVRFVFKNLPLERIHSHAFSAAVAAVCSAVEGKFWGMHDAIFRDPRTITSAGSLREAAAKLNMNIAGFDGCLSDPSPAAVVRRDVSEARALGINSTPTFFIGNIQDGERVRVSHRLKGAVPLEQFRAAVEDALN